MHAAVLVLNALVSLASAAWGMIASARPAALSGSPKPSFGERYFAKLYAIRALPLEVASGMLPWVMRGETVFALLLAAAAVQAADALVGVVARKRDMVIGASVAAVIHAACAIIVR